MCEILKFIIFIMSRPLIRGSYFTTNVYENGPQTDLLYTLYLYYNSDIILCYWFCLDINAVTRTLNLICKVFAPCLVGVFMTFCSMQVSAIMIAIWNVVSMCLEYCIMRKVYHMVPELSRKKREDNVMVFERWCYCGEVNKL